MQLQLVAARHSFSKFYCRSPSHLCQRFLLVHTNGLNSLSTHASPRAPPSAHPHPARPFSSTAYLPRNGGPHEPQRTRSRIQKDQDLVQPAAITEASDDDPFDFSELERGVEKALEKLKEDLGKLRAGGRFNPENLERLRVRVAHNKESVRLGDLAQVVPRGGRTLFVMVGEEDHVRPVSSAIAASPHNLIPVTSPNSPLELSVPIPPPTAESRQATLATATKAGEVATAAVQNARAAQKKLLRAMELARTVRPDDLKKATREMGKVVEEGVRQVREVVEGARRGLGGA